MRRAYSQIGLTSLLDVVFLTLYLLVLTMGDDLRAAGETLEQRAQIAEEAANSAMLAAEASVVEAQRAAEATVSAMRETRQAELSAANATGTDEAQRQQATATSAAIAIVQQESALATQEAQVAAVQATATTAVMRAQTQATVVYATPEAALVAAYATMTAVASEMQQEATAASTQVALAAERVQAAEATAVAAQTAVAAASRDRSEALSVAAAQSTASQDALATAQSMQAEAHQLYEETQQILIAETTDPGITIAKARWVDKYATFYVIRLSPYLDGRSTLELFRGGTFLGSREITSQAQITDFLTALDRSDVADTLVILTFSSDSSDNHREWILNYLNSYNFKYQRILDEDE